MQSLKDIYSSWEKKVIDVRNPDRIISPKVSERENQLLNDVKKWTWKDISFSKKHSIKLSKKTWKNFDALEKSIKKIWVPKKKDIKIAKRTSTFSFSWTVLSAFKKIRNMWYIGAIYICLFSILFLWIIGYLDKIIIENRVNAGYEKLMSLKSWVSGLEDLQKKINNARFDLLIADTLFFPFRILPGEKINSISHVISGWRYLSSSLDDMLALYSATNSYIWEKDISNIYFTQLFENFRWDLVDIEASLSKSIYHYESVSWLPSKDLQNQKDLSVKNLKEIQWYLSTINNDFSHLQNLLGHDERKKYLIVFQNADEIRPTWGFMGSMWLLEIFRWRVQLFQKKDVYAIEWDLKSSDYERLAPPKWIDQITDTFGLRDANYFANIKDSSNTINFFTSRAWLNLDGIIYINQSSLLRMLELTWPIYSEKLEREISAENFSELMSLVVEAKTFKKWTLWTPKQVLFDFMEDYSKKLISEWNYFEYLKVILHDIKSRDIMAWSFSNDDRKVLEDLDLVGNIDYDSSLDFAYPVYTSISWNKSDRYMEHSYTQTIAYWDNCSFNASLEMKLTHNMGKMKRERIQSLINEFELDSPNLFEIQWASPNKQYVRVILPSKSNIREQDGMEIVDYGSRKWVEFFITTEVQQSSFFTIDYTLPNPKCQDYTYKLYKQPGIKDFIIEMSIGDQKFKYQNREEDFYFEVR